jgi:site-specific DNA-methyltransferase (adenine-specific)
MNKIICGDCLEEMKGMADKSVDLIIADPPYGMEFRSNHRLKKHDKIYGDDRFPVEILKEFNRIAKRAVYVFCRWDNLAELPKPRSVIVWVKNNWSMGDLLHEHGRQWEAICFYPQDEHEFIKRIPDVIHADRTGNNLHPTEKPVELIEKIILANVGETILDPMCGSGTTCVAAQNLGRNFIGIEISPEYCKIAEQRLRQKPLL